MLRSAQKSVVLLLLAGSVSGERALHAQAAPDAGISPADRIVVTVVGLRSDRGLVGMALYGRNSRWPEPGAYLADCDVRIVARQATCALTGVRPNAYYAVAITHDENANGRFDQGFLGIPLEGYGFSNDARPFLSAPSFDACRFFYRGGEHSLRITTQY